VITDVNNLFDSIPLSQRSLCISDDVVSIQLDGVIVRMTFHEPATLFAQSGSGSKVFFRRFRLIRPAFSSFQQK
jgi:hypothetical protein